MVTPATEDEIAEIVKVASRTLTPILARGAGSSLTGAAVLEDGIVIDMRRMNKVIKIDPINWYVQVQPGISLDDLNRELKPHGFFFPPDPASSYICTVGGAIAEGSGGLRCVKYGTMKEWVISIRVVLPNGKVTKFGEPLPKNRAGYDLLHLFVGSEGTLGVIIEAYSKIIPLPSVPTKRLLVTFDGWDSVSKVTTEFRRSSVVPALFEFMDKETIQAVNSKLGQNLDEVEASFIVDIDEPDLEKVVKILKSLGSRKIDVAANEEEAENLYQIRSTAFLAVKNLAPACQVEDVTVPLDRLGEYFDMVKQIASEHDLRIPVMGHAGDGNVHPTILYDPSNPSSKKAASEAFEEILQTGDCHGGHNNWGTRDWDSEGQTIERADGIPRRN